MPEINRRVWVTLLDGSECFACWSGMDWYVELDDSPDTAPLVGQVIAWRY